MRISELARRTGVTTASVRFYEAEGVLPAPERAGNGYREYDEDDVCRLRIVVALRKLGLDPEESGRLAALCVGGQCDVMADQLRARVGRQRDIVAAARAELDHLEAELAGLDRALQSGEDTNLCPGKECCA